MAAVYILFVALIKNVTYTNNCIFIELNQLNIVTDAGRQWTTAGYIFVPIVWQR